MKISTFFCLLSILFIAASCGSSNDPGGAANCNTQFSQSFESELEAVSLASQNYGTDPTSENCEAFKQAYIDYLDALEDWEECANFYNQVDQWQQSIDAAKIAANNIVC